MNFKEEYTDRVEKIEKILKKYLPEKKWKASSGMQSSGAFSKLPLHGIADDPVAEVKSSQKKNV